MAEPLRILSRDAFAAVLAEARQRTLALAPERWPLLQQVSLQLDFMAQKTHEGRTPYEDEYTTTTLGPLAARNLEDLDPHYADTLEQLDYAFHRYPHLPKGPPLPRRGILQVLTGRDTFRKLVLTPGEPRTVGTAGADFIVYGRSDGAPHFEITWSGITAHVNAIDPFQLTVDGEPTWYGEMANRGWMTAGGITYRFLVEDFTPPPSPPTPSPGAEAALAELTHPRDAGHLYAVLDAARSDRALQLIEESIDPYNSLYDGEQARALDDVAPYLVHLQPDSHLLHRLIHEGWGDAWGIYIQTPLDLPALRRHLRKFLMVKLEGEPDPVLFRFYDPRVLRTFAEVITHEQTAHLLGDLDRIIAEGSSAFPIILQCPPR
jgi:hypothetical protein